MTTILVGPEQLRAKAEQLRLSAATLSRLLKNVDQAVRGLNPALFEGQRADQVRRRYESQRQQILAAPELLLGYARALDSAAVTQGAKVVEVPVPLLKRKYGESKINLKKEVKNYLLLLFRIFKTKYLHSEWK